MSSVIVTTTLGMGFALVLREWKRNMPLICLVVIPWAMPWVASGLMWRWVFDPNYGSLNGALFSLGLIDVYKAWLGDRALVMACLIFAYSWKHVAFTTFVLYSALQSIPPPIYESGKIDGASWFQGVRFITLPLLKRAILMIATFSTVWALREFDTIWALTQGGPGSETTVLSWYTYAVAFRYLRLGEGSAIGFLLTIVILVFVILYLKMFYTEIEY